MSQSPPIPYAFKGADDRVLADLDRAHDRAVAGYGKLTCLRRPDL